MIIGVGIDVVDIGRFEQTLERTPALRERLFTEEERGLGIASLAARFAAPAGMHWTDARVVTNDEGKPSLEIGGTVLARANDLGVDSLHVSLSHDAGVASAVVIAEG